jgi:hypothetical protein
MTTANAEADMRQAALDELACNDRKTDLLALVGNIVALLVLLVIFGGAWFVWGQWGFPYTHGLVSSYAKDQSDRLRKEAAVPTALPTPPATTASSAVASASAPVVIPMALVPATPSAIDITTAVGQSGDAYGGANALFSALVAALAAWAGFLQYRALMRAQRAYRDERDANRQAKADRTKEEVDRKLARFESQFFQLLTLVKQTRDAIVSKELSDNPRKFGSAALDAFADTIFKEAASSSKTIPLSPHELVYHYQRIYNRRPSVLGPYFRLLFQTFQYISKNGKDLDTQLQYSKIARGQMSDGSVLLLALNGMTIEGHAFVEYIEEFGLLEHMLPKYKKAYEEHLDKAYRKRAYKGSKERDLEEFKHNPVIPFVEDLFHWTPDQIEVRKNKTENHYPNVDDDTQS